VSVHLEARTEPCPHDLDSFTSHRQAPAVRSSAAAIGDLRNYEPAAELVPAHSPPTTGERLYKRRHVRGRVAAAMKSAAAGFHVIVA